MDKRQSVIERRVIEKVRQAPPDEGIKEDKRQSVKERRVNENVRQAPRDEGIKQSNNSLREQNYTGNKELDVEKKKERAETKTARDPENTGISQKPATH